MTGLIRIRRASPLTTIQDEGRFGMLRHGISASGPMDRGGYRLAGALVGAGQGGIEFTMAGIEIVLTSGDCRVGFAGGDFRARHNGKAVTWPGAVMLAAGDSFAVTPGRWGNYGYLRFEGGVVGAPVMGSVATSSRVALGGFEGRALRAGDEIELGGGPAAALDVLAERAVELGPIRVIWGLHADIFPAAIRQRFVGTPFKVSTRLDRMGVRLDDFSGIFAGATILSLVSDAIVPGDIQILGDGTPIVLMADHQPTGGYPRIATVISADRDRFAQMRPGTELAFEPVTVEHAHRLLRSALQ